MHQPLFTKIRLLKHIIKHHMIYIMGILTFTTFSLFYVEKGTPNFHHSKHFLQGNLIEIATGSYFPPTVLLPQKGEAYRPGEVLPIHWEAKTDVTDLYLVSQKRGQPTLTIQKQVKGHQWQWILPETLPAGDYKIGLKNGHDLGKSDGFFKVLSEQESGVRNQRASSK